MYNYSSIIDIAKKNQCDVFTNQIMKQFTSFKIGGPADVMIKVNDVQTLSTLMKECKNLHIPFFTLGNGSNLLISDKGIRGVVFKLGGEFDKISLEGETKIKCGPSVSLSKLCGFALENSLTGLEFAWGIPGSVGGAVFMNAGAYGGQMDNVLVSCEHIDLEGNVGSFNKDQLELGYRKSVYSKNHFVVTSITFELQKGDKQEIKQQMNELMKRRKDKQPLEFPSAGSIFKRPLGNYAGTLIQECGLKGCRVGGAMVSEKHGNFIINVGNATCQDVLELIDIIKKRVFEEKNIELECEVKRIGEV